MSQKQIVKIEDFDVQIFLSDGFLDIEPEYSWTIVQESKNGGHVGVGFFKTFDEAVQDARNHIKNYGNRLTLHIYTSYYGNVKKLLALKYDNFVCVSGKIPFEIDNKKFRYFRELAPKYEWWKEWKEKFKDNYESQESKKWYKKKYYQTVLSKLDPHDIAKRLGDKAILLCYEKPENFCHRKLIAQWLQNHLNISVQEL